MENTRVRLKNLSSRAVVCPFLCSHLCTMLGIAPAEESPSPLGFWLRVSLSLSCLWAISGALGTFPAYATAEIAPLSRPLVNIQKRKCRSTVGFGHQLGWLYFSAVKGLQSHRMLWFLFQFVSFWFFPVCLIVSLHSMKAASEGHSYVCSLCIWETGISSFWHLQKKCCHPLLGRGRKQCFLSGHSWDKSHPLLPGCFWHLQSPPACECFSSWNFYSASPQEELDLSLCCC